MDLGLKDKVALVTGGAKGIGYAIAKAFLEEGCKAVIVDTDTEQLRAAERELSALGDVAAVRCDVTKTDDVIALFRETGERFGRLDVLVNNVGVLKPAKIAEMSEELWNFTLDVNIKGTFLCSKYGYELMKKTGGGAIINGSSFAALIPSVGHAAYAAAKAAVANFTKTAAAEFAPAGVRVNAYIPGVVATHLTSGMRADPEKSEKMLRDIPLRRFADPSEIAPLVVFLASEKASYLTASVVEIHGGKLCVQDPFNAY